MGADIYLNSLYEANTAKYRPLFENACEIRNSLPQFDLKKQKKAQEIVEYFYDKMHDVGYFRDAYNGGGLFARLDLSWWQLADELCDPESRDLPVAAAQVLLDRLDKLDVDRSFKAWVKAKRAEGWKFRGKDQSSVKDWRKNTDERLAEFKALLRQSIELNEPLHWSV